MFCASCGTSMPSEAKFCMECGSAIGGGPQGEPEFCQITYRSGYVRRKNVMWFVADAVGPQGPYEAATSEVFETSWTYDADFLRRDHNAATRDSVVVAAHRVQKQLISDLIGSGWTPAGRGDQWYEHKFSRRARHVD